MACGGGHYLINQFWISFFNTGDTTDVCKIIRIISVLQIITLKIYLCGSHLTWRNYGGPLQLMYGVWSLTGMEVKSRVSGCWTAHSSGWGFQWQMKDEGTGRKT